MNNKFPRADSAGEIHGSVASLGGQKAGITSPPRELAHGERTRFTIVVEARAVDSLAEPARRTPSASQKPVGPRPPARRAQDALAARMRRLSQIEPDSKGREAGLVLPRLGDELALLAKMDETLWPAFEAAARPADEQGWAAAVLARRDRMTSLFVAHAYPELAEDARAVGSLARSPAMAAAVRVLRLEALLLARHRRAQLAHAGRPAPHGAPAAARATPHRDALAALEGALVGLVVRPL